MVIAAVIVASVAGPAVAQVPAAFEVATVRPSRLDLTPVANPEPRTRNLEPGTEPEHEPGTEELGTETSSFSIMSVCLRPFAAMSVNC